MKNIYSNLLISSPGTRIHNDMLTLEVRLPWYRALPLSVVQFVDASVDGVLVPLAAAEVELNGKRFSLTAAAEQISEFWFVLDSAFVHIPLHVDTRQTHHIELLLKLYPPYIPMLVWSTRGSATTAAH